MEANQKFVILSSEQQQNLTSLRCHAVSNDEDEAHDASDFGTRMALMDDHGCFHGVGSCYPTRFDSHT